ncbi:hypothetical protein JAAARDRAFT_34921 [Jaapia argillacea MUCL 33604]|uniref:SEP domain-containing protein n=1 Tax=Jaapia argillacea MUCL 33604 TaxID=933084 RepID=A0A067PTR2_9AGAM|nr:hypothetical protein JAAARDRAFT_34921 [Jaapia argillacea MUCL 33604]
MPELADEIAAIRHITFWRDGFSIGDGELMRYEDPANTQILSEIHSGWAPPRLLNVLPGQFIELRVANRLSEDYTPAPLTDGSTSDVGPSRASVGSGNQLESPIPAATGEASGSGNDQRGTGMPSGCSTTETSAVPTSTSVTEKGAEGVQTKLELDHTKEMMGEQIRSDGGTRMVPRMNLTNIVRDIKNFFNAYVSSPPDPPCRLFWTLLNTCVLPRSSSPEHLTRP